MVSSPRQFPTSSRLPLANEPVAKRLDEIAEIFEAKASNPYRVRAYRNAAQTIRDLDRPVAEILGSQGMAGLMDLSGIGQSIAHTIERFVTTGDEPLLARLRGRALAGAVLMTVPGVGPLTAARIQADLRIETLAELEQAAYDGRLAHLPGMGYKRLRAIRESLAGRFGHHPRPPVGDAEPAVWQPPLTELLSIDEEYRRKAEAGRLLQVSPARFNPTGEAWLPILRTRRAGRGYTALYSNTPLAHERGTTHDWVVIFRDGSGGRGQWTVVTDQRGAMQGLRVVRGRERECAVHYAQLKEPELKGTDIPPE